MAESYDIAYYSIEEQHGIECPKGLHHCHDEYCAVDTSDCHKSLVEEIGHKHEESQKRMAIDIIACAPFRHYAIGDGVEARDMEIAYEECPVETAWVYLSKQSIVFIYHEGMQNDKQQEYATHK